MSALVKGAAAAIVLLVASSAAAAGDCFCYDCEGLIEAEIQAEAERVEDENAACGLYMEITGEDNCQAVADLFYEEMDR